MKQKGQQKVLVQKPEMTEAELRKNKQETEDT